MKWLFYTRWKGCSSPKYINTGTRHVLKSWFCNFFRNDLKFVQMKSFAIFGSVAIIKDRRSAKILDKKRVKSTVFRHKST